ncbi:MAG TPA: hypothetical protein VHF26_25965 [Trebonia sp.]|nr:hypothetical protein [Trebonia sp.]
MRDIAKLLFGGDAGKLLDLLGGGGDRFGSGDGDGFGLAERARRAGEWCGTTPGRGAVAAAVRPGRSQRPPRRLP